MLNVILALVILLMAQTAGAYPNMIRLGYVACATCHASPQGGGVLTRYGRGIDYAQTIRDGEPPDAERPGDALSRVLYDVRLQMAVDHQQGSDAEYSFNSNVRTAIAVNARNRLVYAFGVRSPALAINRRMGAATLGMSRLYWMYQPRDGVALVVGRDELPTGLGLPGVSAFYKTVNNPNVSATPTQAKMFWWNRRWQLAGYGYGPDGNEAQPQYRARGAGALGGLNLWRDRAVVGLAMRVSAADAFDRRNAGAFARVGFNDHVGVLAEHDVTERVLSTGRRFTHVAGHAEAFFIPVNWLQTALAVEHLNTVGGASTYRLSPSAEVRLTPNFRLQFSTRNVYADADSRTYSIQLQVKAE
jgi:hypothetical protein